MTETVVKRYCPEQYAKMRTGFNALMLEVEPSIVNDLIATFEEYVQAARPSESSSPQPDPKLSTEGWEKIWACLAL